MKTKQGGDQYTQGEWETEECRDSETNVLFWIYIKLKSETKFKWIADVKNINNENEAETIANAELIVSAPLLAQENKRLKEANEKMLEALDDIHDTYLKKVKYEVQGDKFYDMLFMATKLADEK